MHCQPADQAGGFRVLALSGSPQMLPHADNGRMASRHHDWLRQGKRDLDHARRSAANGDCEWACFAAQQGAEKALKAVFQRIGSEAWGHSVTGLLNALPSSVTFESDLATAAMDLDKHYIAARSPSSYPEGARFEYYARGEASRAIANAEQLVDLCEGVLARSAEGD